MRTFPPERVVCLTEETVETLYLLEQQDRIVGVSGFAVRPPGVTGTRSPEYRHLLRLRFLKSWRSSPILF